jgi:phosphoribosylaminoimidazole-succinocarboxamide synthase
VNVITPTTKAEDHDVPISPSEIVKQDLMSQDDWDTVREQVGHVISLLGHTCHCLEASEHPLEFIFMGVKELS